MSNENYPEYYEFNGVTYNIDWSDYKSINLFINHLDQVITQKEFDSVDALMSDPDTDDLDLSEAQDMLRAMGVNL